ncbi:sortase B protein-sorting domain-containing protein [Listeria ivanovii]|nr:sortase B protein-sorting domain-containing protein [Listeria ivanovii]MCJ1734306.1 sortase B protein-sorting domain-containing protein [Listeria ivanovii]
MDPTNPTNPSDPSKSAEISVQVKAETPKNSNLPKTGDTKANAPIFLFAGTLLIISGIVLLKRSTKAK